MAFLLRPPGELAALPTRLKLLGLACRRAVVLAGVFRFFAVVLAAVTLLTTLDAVVSLPSFVRACGLVGTLALGGLTLLRGVLLPALQPVRTLNVARELERRYPRLNDSLASAVEFLEDVDDSRRGSLRLRRIAVLRAENILGRHTIDDIVPHTQAWRAFWLLVLALIVAVPLAVTNTTRAGRAVVRFMVPFGSAVLPTRTHITVTEPAKFPVRVAKGEPFDLRFTLDGAIPERAIVLVRAANGSIVEDSLLTNGVVPSGTAELELRLESGRIPQDFAVKIRANDTETEWLPVTVAPPPKLIPRDGRASPQMHLDYPAYTELKSVDSPDGASAIEAIAGTRIVLRAATDRRITSAVLRPQVDVEPYKFAAAFATTAGTNPLAIYGAQHLANQIADDIPVRVTGDGTLLDAEFVPFLSGLYTLRFTDDTGLTGSRLLEMRITSDPSPVVALDRPALGKDSLTLLNTASLPILAHAEDRTFAVRSLQLEYRIGGIEALWQTIPLQDVSTQTTATSALASSLTFATAKPVSVTAGREFAIAGFRKSDGKPPADGDVITIRAVADDWDTVSVLKSPGRSKEIEIRVVGKTSLDAILQQELARLRPELLRLRGELRTAREGVTESAKVIADGKPATETIDKLRAAEQTQRGVRNKVADPRDGLQAAAEQLRNIVRANSLPRSTTTDRVEAIAKDLARLAEQGLDPAEQQLAAAREQAERAPKAGSQEQQQLASALTKTGTHQKAAEKTLEDILRQLEQWGGASEVRAEARTLKDQLTKANEAADKATSRVQPGKPADKLSSTEAAELARAAEKYSELAERADGTLAKAEQLAKEKDKQAKEARDTATTKEAAAAAARAEAAKQPAGSAAAKEAQKAAATAESEASAAKATAEQATAEAAALRKAASEAGGQELVDSLRAAGSELRKNNTSRSNDARQAAAERLDKLSQALTEKPKDNSDELIKKKTAADDIDKLATEQDELRKKVKKANQIADPMKREEELGKLAREQEKLREKVEEQAEKLSRNHQTEPAAEQLRKAAEQMAAAKGDIEQGKPSDNKQADALEKLDAAADALDKERQTEKSQLDREKRGALAEALTALRDRLKATDDEASRLQVEVMKAKGWDRAKLASLRDLDDRAKAIADELQTFSDKQLAPLPVFRQLIDQAAILTDRAAKLFAERKESAVDGAGNAFDAKSEISDDDRTRRPLRTALRRVEHVLNALKEDQKPPAAQPAGEMPPMPEMPPPPMEDAAKPNQEGVPPLAQLKALRSIQSELNERTAAFAKAHPDKAKYEPADREELQELERTQREVAELIRTIAPALMPMPPMETP